MRLVPPTKAYRDPAAKKKGKWHFLRGEVTTICNYVLPYDHRDEIDVADLEPGTLCQKCWRFGAEPY